MWSRKPKVTPTTAARDLREQALSITPADLAIAPGPGHERAWGIIMETGLPRGIASLVCFADGTTSLYLSNGGGVVGAGDHESVRAAATSFLSIANDHIDAFQPASGRPVPAIGRVRFYVHTFDGLLTAEAGEQDLGQGRHVLTPLFHVGQAVSTAIRVETGAG